MDKFDKYFRQKFENYEVEPSADLWDKISANIAGNQGFGWKGILTSAVAVVTAAILAIWGLNAKSGKDSITVFTPSEITVPAIIKQSKPIEESIGRIKNTQVYFAGRSHKQADSKTDIREIADNMCVAPAADTASVIEHISQCLIPENYKYTIKPYRGCAPLEVEFRISGLKGFEKILWFIDQNEISHDSILVYTLDSGLHSVSLVISSGDEAIIIVDTITVRERPESEFAYDSAVAGKVIHFDNKSINAVHYIWDFGDGYVSYDENPDHVYSQPGLYRVRLIASNDDCSDTLVSTIDVSDKQQNIIFPNAFIPSASGGNGGYYNANSLDRSVFYPKTRKPVRDYLLQIYDRNGKLLFVSKDVNIGWDGYYRNKRVPMGVYVYVVKGSFTDGEKFYLKGDVTVVYGE